MCFSKISDISCGNFVHRKDNYKFIHVTILLFSFTDLLFQNDCHRLSQDKPTNERHYFNRKKLTD